MVAGLLLPVGAGEVLAHGVAAGVAARPGAAGVAALPLPLESGVEGQTIPHVLGGFFAGFC